MLVVESTLRYYDDNAPDVADAYERVDFHRNVDRFSSHLEPGSTVLEVGCGSGRDASYLIRRGYGVQAIDGSIGMIREAERLHPELSGHARVVPLPAGLPYDDETFDGVMSWAVLMHLETDGFASVLREIRRVTREGGVFAYSVNTERLGIDSSCHDEHGRRFTCLSAAAWERLHVAAGFATLTADESGDIIGREGVRWVTFITRR